jgi:hypothetical protein
VRFATSRLSGQFDPRESARPQGGLGAVVGNVVD